MLNKINTIFSTGVNKEMLKENEEMYDSYFSVLLGNYSDSQKDNKYFKGIFSMIH